MQFIQTNYLGDIILPYLVDIPGVDIPEVNIPEVDTPGVDIPGFQAGDIPFLGRTYSTQENMDLNKALMSPF